MDPQTNMQYLKGVGPARAQLYHKLGIDTIYALIYHFPRAYLDLSVLHPVAERGSEEAVAVRACVCAKKPEVRLHKGMSLFKLTAADDTGEMTVTFFNTKYAFEALKIGEEYIFYGSVKPGPHLEMSTPLVFPVSDAGTLRPVYALTAGLTSRTVSQNVRQALCIASLSETLPEAVRVREGLCLLAFALENIHFPQSPEAAQTARRRLIFEELFTLALALQAMRQGTRAHTAVQIARFDPSFFYATLPFEPTEAQRRSVDEILSDMEKEVPMNRLLQGDVGSGKTLVAAVACLASVKGGYQCAIMAPTEILAEQHRVTFEAFLSAFGVRVEMLTGGMGVQARREALARIATGEAQVVIGTHALLTQGVQFACLGLTVTDEQHRFGVGQRMALQVKSGNPHVLVMSATPIPRTLALMIYGDLDLSVLDEMPHGRRVVETYCISTRKLPRAWAFVQKHLDEGRQAYVVCPLVCEGEEALPGGLRAVQQVAEELRDGPFQRARVGVLHGKLSGKEKNETMHRFKSGEIQILVCTTVVEVGVDVPNAAVMVCLNAERFGLSQLHQLRGRVGRGTCASSCILVSDARGETARERLRALCETADGFQLAQTDLKQRGPGEFFGNRQHGLPEMRIADMAQDTTVLEHAWTAAQSVWAEDPALTHSEHRALAYAVARMLKNVGGRPN